MDKKVIKYLSKAPEKKENRVLRFIGSDEGIDRDNEKVMSAGWKLKEYKKNPVVMLNHRHSEMPVAKAVKVWVDTKSKNNPLTFDIEFPEPEVSSIGDTLYKLYSNGYMSATSVGFKPDYDKIVYGDGMKTPRAIFNGQELLELSLVSVPANPRALLSQKGIQDAIEAKVIDQLELDELSLLFDTLFDEEEEDVDKEVDELEDVIDKLEKEIKEDISDDVDDIEQTINEPVYCHECGKNINKDNPDSDYLTKLFDDFCKPKEVDTEDEDISLTDELLNKYFQKE